MEPRENFKKIRQELGLSQSQMAKDLGVSKELVSQIETGQKDISANTLNSLSSLLEKRRTSFFDKYKRGQRLSHIVGELRELGYSLPQLRDEIFKVKGSFLSSMYFGLAEIPKTILDQLTGLNVNLDYLDEGTLPIILGAKDVNNVRVFRVPILLDDDILSQLLNLEAKNNPGKIEIDTLTPGIDGFVCFNAPKFYKLPEGDCQLGIQKVDKFEPGIFLCRISFTVFLVYSETGTEITKSLQIAGDKEKFNPLNISQRFLVREVRYGLN